jgi:hypothetical protein
MRLKKLIFKFINLFKILEYINKFIYKLNFLSLYNKLYLIFYIFFFKKYIIKKN